MLNKSPTLIVINYILIFNCYWSIHVASTKTQSKMEKATSSKSTGSVKRSAEQNIIFGGILNEFTPDVKVNDTDLQNVVEFALNHAVKQHPKTIPRDDKDAPLPPDVFHPRKLKLQVTKDGTTPYIYHEESFEGGQRKIQRKRAIAGINYYFTLTWNKITSAYQHNFIIRKDREHKLYLHGHTFYRPTKNVLKSVASAQPQSDKLTGVNHAMPVFVPILPMQLTSQASCAEEGNMNLEGCQEPQENVWKESAEHEEHLATSPEKQSLNASVKLVTYNIWNFNSVLKHFTKKFYEARIKRLGQVVSAAEADIIGFQEVRFDVTEKSVLGPSQVRHLAEHLPHYQFVYQPADFFMKTMAHEGLAIFSKYPILSYDFILLSRNEEDEEDRHQRVCLHAEIETPQLGIFHAYVSHFSLSAEARQRNMVEIWKYMSRHSGPAVFMGDLNAEPDSPEIKFLQGAAELQGVKTSGLVDAWTVFHPEPRPDVPSTYQEDEERDYGLTFSALDEHLRKRIDYIFVRLPDDIKLTEVSMLDDGKRQHAAPTDHLGVQASLRHSTSQ